MNTPNPLIPQGALPNVRGRSHIRIAVFTILAVHVVLLGALLMAGCKKTAEQAKPETADGGPPPFNADQLPPTNPSPPVVAQTTAPPVVVTSTPVVVTPPPPLPVTPPPILNEGTEHTVIKGDSFFTLAKKYNVRVSSIASANPGVDSSKLKIGQKIKIPPSMSSSPATPAGNGGTATLSTGSDKVYTVKSGDTLNRIARDNSVTLKALRAENNLKTDQIKVGQKLRIPAKGSSPADSPSTPTGTGTTP